MSYHALKKIIVCGCYCLFQKQISNNSIRMIVDNPLPPVVVHHLEARCNRFLLLALRLLVEHCTFGIRRFWSSVRN